jgi:hypothetical protein
MTDLIKETKKRIESLAAEQDRIYQELVERIGESGRREEFLFDYIFNDNDHYFSLDS